MTFLPPFEVEQKKDFGAKLTNALCSENIFCMQIRGLHGIILRVININDGDGKKWALPFWKDN